VKILLLNWAGGENDPFTFFFEHLAEQFSDVGCTTHTVNLANGSWKEVIGVLEQRIDLAICFQGVGSSISIPPSNQNIWEMFRIPLISLHGDHPSHNPANHSVDNGFVKHIYLSPSLNHYSDRYFHRRFPSFFLRPPVIFKQSLINDFSGDYFVFPKNLDDVKETIDSWKTKYPPNVASLLTETASEIIRECDIGGKEDHHVTIDRVLERHGFEAKTADDMALFHSIHGLLDKIYRNHVAETVVNELKDFPLVIYGRGWDKFQKNRPSSHEFRQFTKLSDGESQYASNFGVIDVAANRDRLHDRTLRAISHGSGFLNNSQVDFGEMFGQSFDGLFYTCEPGSLQDRAERVLQNPKLHREACIEFGRLYAQHFGFYNFYQFLCSFVMQKSA
jgi:hypothetical protein